MTDPDYSILDIEGVLSTEFGVPFAKTFPLFERKFSVGVTSEIIDLKSLSYQESILTIERIKSPENKSDLGTFATVDMDFACDLSNSFRLGVSIRYLITKEFDVGGQVLNFDTGACLGMAYHNRFLTLALDYDLKENEPLLSNPEFGDLKTQFLAVGAEFNAFDFAQLRIGAEKI